MMNCNEIEEVIKELLPLLKKYNTGDMSYYIDQLSTALDILNSNISITEKNQELYLSLIHISEPTRRTPISYAVFCLKKIFLMIRRPPRSTPLYSSAASDVYKRQTHNSHDLNISN